MGDAELLTKEIEKATVEHAAIVEKMQADSSEALQSVQERAAERVDLAQERAKVAESKVDAARNEAQERIEDFQGACNEAREKFEKTIHDQGKTIARMKGEIRHWREQNPDGNPYIDEDDEDTPAGEQPGEPVPGENEETG